MKKMTPLLKRLMADPALRISEVAEQVEYADTAHFSRVFKKMGWRVFPPVNGGIPTVGKIDFSRNLASIAKNNRMIL